MSISSNNLGMAAATEVVVVVAAAAAEELISIDSLSSFISFGSNEELINGYKKKQRT